MKTLIRYSLLVSIYTALAFAQDVPAPGRMPPTGDPIKGVWKLNVDKSKNATAESEVVTIASQESGYKLTFDIKQSNGYNPKYDIVTDMKGDGTVKPIYADGKETNDSWRVTRQSANAFEMELIGPFGGWTDKYEVSSDGGIMTLHRLPSNKGLVGARIDGNGAVHHPELIMVFERAK